MMRRESCVNNFSSLGTLGGAVSAMGFFSEKFVYFSIKFF